jgi:hypothetical protein
MPKSITANSPPPNFGRYYVLFTPLPHLPVGNSLKRTPPFIPLAALASKHVFVLSIDAYGALVILYELALVAVGRAIEVKP